MLAEFGCKGRWCANPMPDANIKDCLAWHATSVYGYVDVEGRLGHVTETLVGIALPYDDAVLISRSRLSLASDLIVQNEKLGNTVMLKVKRA